MTTFELVVPLIALVVAGIGAGIVHFSDKRLERRERRHPAE
ncbi:hypothetical protein [Tranquillimonas rosea]